MRPLKIIFPILISVMLIILSPYSAFAISESLEFESEEYPYGSYLYGIEKNDEAKIGLILDANSNSNINFSYTIHTRVEIMDVIGGLISYNETNNFMANGSISPGEELILTHRILECQIDQIPAITFDLKKSNILKVSLNLTIEVINKNDNDCGGQLYGPNFGFPLDLIILVLIIFIVFVIVVKRLNRSFKDIC